MRTNCRLEDCKLLWTAEVGHCSNSVDWRGSNFRIRTLLFTGPQRWHRNCIYNLRPVLPATHEAAAATVVSLIREEVEWAKYKPPKLVGVNHCDWQWHVTEAHVVMLFACIGDGAAAKSLGLRAETVTIWPSRLSHVNHATNAVMVVL